LNAQFDSFLFVGKKKLSGGSPPKEKKAKLQKRRNQASCFVSSSNHFKVIGIKQIVPERI
jgi:hypothetical protein